MSDAEIFLLCWAVVATVLAFKYRDERDGLGKMLKVLFMEPKARADIFARFDEFKEKHGL